MNRRNFLTNGLMAGGSLFLPSWLSAQAAPRRASHPFGIQVWSVKDQMAADPQGTLRRLVGYGYKSIESFEGDKGMFWGMKPKEWRQFLAGLGARSYSAHANITDNFERKAAEAAEAGMHYLICPWLGPQKSIDDFKRFADQFNQAGEVCRQNGLRFAYHNHDYSFQSLEGQIPQHLMLRNTDPELVDFEMDIYWVVTAGKDPVAEARLFPNRYRLCHVKQRMANSKEQNASTVLHNGIIHYAKVLPALKKHGMLHYLVEQEKFDGTTPMAAAKANAAFIRRLEATPASRGRQQKA